MNERSKKNMNIKEYIILNEIERKIEKDSIIDDPLVLSKNLQKLILKLKGENLLDEKRINYSNLAESELFKQDYLNLAFQLKHIDLNKLVSPKNDTNILAFFINIYNALTIHALTYLHQNGSNLNSDNVSILSQLDGKFWSKMAYKIGLEGYAFSLDDIEHGILRANRVHPSSKKSFFEPNDERLKYKVDSFENKIHFALNCGAKGCPPISFYTPDNLNKAIQMASVNFITSETKVNLDAKLVEISRLFLWYKQDFIDSNNSDADNKQILRFIYDNLRDGESVKEDLKALIETNQFDLIKIEYLSYDWNINSKN